MSRLVLLTGVACLLLTDFAIGQQPERKAFGKNHPFTMEELPAGELKTKLQTLDPQARGKAMKWLHNLEFGEADAAHHLRVDRQGGIFIVCPDNGGCKNKACGHDHSDDGAPVENSAPAPEEETTESTETTTEITSTPTTESAAVSIDNPPVYHSKPGAPNVIYLDFNGGIVSGTAWNGTVTSFDTLAWSRDTDRDTFSESEQVEIRQIWERMAEDFAPFDVNVTTDTAYDPDIYTGDRSRVAWCLFTPGKDRNGVSNPHDGYGGIAYVNVFGQTNYAYYSPAWNQDYGQANAAEVGSHEIGHNMGMSHDGLTTGAEYYGGHAAVTGVATSWGPIMGTGYNRNVSQWSKSTEYYNGNRTQDDLTILAGKLTYRTDDHGDTFGTATAWTSGTVDQAGIIERTNDIDTFTFDASAGTISLNAATYRSESGTWGGNLDILLELYDNSGTLIASHNPADQVNASISVSVPAGRYYVMLKPTGAGDPLSSTPSGYTDYGSLGQYTITGNFIPEDGVFLSSPSGGESWFRGASYNITWGSAMGGNVKLELLKGGALHSTIATSTPNDGSYSWTIPSEQPTGSDYKIRITSVEQPTKSDESASNFSITVDPLAEALDSTGLVWTTSGNLPWFYQTTTTYDGVDAAQSGAITHSQTSAIQTTIDGSGTMTFWWKVSSESGYDFLRFFLNGIEQTGSLARISGDVNWVQKTVNLPTGSNVVEWRYTKDGSVSANADTAWVDQVVFTSTSSPLIVVEQPAGTGLTDGASTVDFGSVNVGSSDLRTFTIRNDGTEDLTGLALSKSGTHNADYTLGSLSTTTLIPDASITFDVTFTPGDAGTRTAALHIASNDTLRNPFDINLTGNGLGPGSLSVAGTDGLNSSGNYAGPFSPSSIEYTLSNPGNTSIEWTAGKTANWVTLSPGDGTLAAGASTNLTVSINSNANTLNAGSYNDTVTFTNTTNGSGNTTRAVALTVNQAPATVTLGNLAQTYDGSPKSVSVTTDPTGISTNVTYDGSGTAPTNAGTYAVVATITNPNYTGSDSKNLVIAKAAQTITFDAINNVGDDAQPFELTGSASSGLTVSYTSSNTAVATISGSTVTIVGPGTTTITASQAGDTNYQAATPVPRELTVFQTNVAEAVIYEPFDDADSTLTGNTVGKGFTGTWLGSGTVVPNSLAYGNLPAGTGNTASINNQNGYVSTGTTLSATGLLDDGASLWFSALVQTGGDIATNGDLGFALGTDQIDAGNNLPISNSGQALGFTFKNNQLRASHWVPGDLIRSSTNGGNSASPDTLYLVVGKITWGASSETIEIFRPDTNLSLGVAVSTYTTPGNLDQAQFNIVSFGSKSATTAHLFDEIRFGASYESVIGLGKEIPGYLSVTPTDNLTASGLVGGTFSPSSIDYNLRNPGSDAINWTAGKTADWLDLSATGGTLAGGASIVVTVSINNNANSLVAGVYNDTVSFANTTNSTGDTTRSMSLTINTPETYTVSYDGNANTSGTTPSNQTKTENVDLTLSDPGTLLRTGYTFAGWNTAPDGSGTNYAAGATYTANASATLYAHWTANIYTVTFDANGGETPNPTNKSVTYGSTYDTLATTTRTGYSFNGWFTAAVGGDLVTTGTPVTIAADHTLHAQWTQLIVEIDVSRNATVIPVGGYDAIADTTVNLGAKLNYDIANGGTDTLTLGNAVISAAINCVVAIDGQPSASVSPSNLTNLALTATPSAAGAWSFTVSIANNDPAKNPYQWTVHGVAASSETEVLTAVADTYIDAAKAGSNDGDATTFSIWNRFQGKDSRQFGLLLFDVSSIPSNATITSASIDLVQSNDVAGLVDIVEVTNSWTENGATWTNSNALVGSTSYGSESAPGTTGASVPSLILNSAGLAKLHGWIATPASNYGFGVKTTNTANKANIDLYTREHGTPANRPKLTLSYSTNPQIAKMHVTRGGSLVAGGGTDPVSDTVAESGTQLTYSIANLGNIDLTLTTPVSVSDQSNCAVVVNTQPSNIVAASTATNLVVTITPTATGAWSANLSVLSNDPDQSPYSWTISGTAMSIFDNWAGNSEGSVTITFDGDANNDGVADGLAWLLGATIPSENANSRLPLAGEDSGDLVVNFDYLNSAQRGSATLHFQYSNSLAPDSWTSVQVPETSSTVNGVVFTVTPILDTNINRVEATIPASHAGGASKLFGRLSATLP